MPVHNIRSEKELKDILVDNQVVIVDFFATWCDMSKTLAPIFVEQSNRDNHRDILFGKLDVDEAQELSTKLGITSTPTFHIYKNGTKVNEYVTPGPQALLQFIDEAAK